MTSKLRPTLGLDLGGANLKAAHTDGAARTVPFALWKQPLDLTEALRALFRQMPPAEQIAVTMTGELCDCYADRREGVHAILAGLESALAQEKVKKEEGKAVCVRVWQTTGRFCSVEDAKKTWPQTASANWLATATHAKRLLGDGVALVLDLGSTTADLTLIEHGEVQADARDDAGRLRAGTLLYTGAARTPLLALVDAERAATLGLPFGLVAERFADMADVHVLLERRPEALDDCETSDGRPLTREWARNRLLRQLGLDRACVEEAEADTLARRLATAADEAQQRLLVAALRRACAPRQFGAVSQCLLVGSGEFLLRRALAALRFQGEIISWADTLGPELSTAAAAHAVAVLLAEETG